MSNITIIDMPLFIPQYECDKSYGYKGANGERLLELLYKTTKGYCMYCYSKIEVDSKRFGQLEHAIEKKYTKQSAKLTECVPNIGLACSMCNTSFKRVGDSVSIFTDNQIKKFDNEVCTKEKCTKECLAYKRIKRAYLQKRKIILQPMGVTVKGHTYRIQYNLLTLTFEPSHTVAYTEDEKGFIKEHILKFNLNDPVYRTREVLKFCEDIINGDKYLRKGKYNNYIVDLFMHKLENLDEEARIKLCSTIYKIGKNKRII